MESGGFEEKRRVVIEGGHPKDELVGQRQGMVEPALWRRKRFSSPLSHQGVCRRHDVEDSCVTPGELIESPSGIGVTFPIRATEMGEEVL